MDEFSIAHKWVFVSFSGGKDSVASYIEATKQYPKNIIRCVFTDTGWEHPETYEYLRYFNDNVHPVTRLVSRIKSERNGRRYFENIILSWDRDVEYVRENFHTVLDEFRDRNSRYPTIPPYPARNARHCTKTVKIRPFERYIRSLVPRSERHMAVCVIGIRHDESDARSSRSVTSINTDNGHDEWYPITAFSYLDTFRSARRNGIQFNQVYRYSKRSNCVFCPFADMDTIIRTERIHNGIMDDIRKFERDTGWTLQYGKSLDESCTEGHCEL